MDYTKEELDELCRACCARKEELVKEYRRTHKVPSRGTISTPEIEAENAEIKRLFGEYCKLRDKGLL